jgi:hypothetical protein
MYKLLIFNLFCPLFLLCLKSILKATKNKLIFNAKFALFK